MAEVKQNYSADKVRYDRIVNKVLVTSTKGKDDFVPATDLKGKHLKNKWVSPNVQWLEEEYLDTCQVWLCTIPSGLGAATKRPPPPPPNTHTHTHTHTHTAPDVIRDLLTLSGRRQRGIGTEHRAVGTG